MKLAEITGERQVRIVEREDPAPAEDLVLVRVDVAPMCTEYKSYRGGHRSDCLGHEAAGMVLEVAQPGHVKPGDRVVVMPMYACGCCDRCLAGDYIYCQCGLDVKKITSRTEGAATYADRLLKSDWQLIPIPNDLSTEHAAMACCGLGPTFGAMQRMAVDAFDTVLITGQGPVGLGGVINARFRGARVLAVESHPYRARLARELGAEEVIDPNSSTAREQIRDLTHGAGVDKALDCSGVAAAQRLLIDSVRRRGQVAFIGEGGDLTVHVSNDLLRKGLTLHGSWHWNLADSARLMQVIRSCGPQINRLITHRFPLERVQEAFELQLTGECGKVLLLPPLDAASSG